MPVCSSATGLGCEYVHLALLHPTENRHNIVELGLAGIGPKDPVVGVMLETECEPSLVPCGNLAGGGGRAGRTGLIGGAAAAACFS